MARLQDWQPRLMAAVREGARTPFAWGEHDCCMFAAACVDAMCGGDLKGAIRGLLSYTDEIGAYRAIVKAGGLDYLVTTFIGNPLPNPRYAQPGDVVLLVNEGRDVLGIVVGHAAIAAAPSGVVTLSLADVRAAWSI